MDTIVQECVFCGNEDDCIEGVCSNCATLPKEKLQIAQKNKGVPTDVIKQDITDTEAEITAMEREIKGFRLVGDRISNFKADARISGIKEKQDFIEKLKVILEVRDKK